MEIKFNKAKYSSRILSFLMDFVIMAMISLTLMIASRSILFKVPYYQNAKQTINEISELTGLYKQDNNGDWVSLKEYYQDIDETTAPTILSDFDASLRSFYHNENFFKDDSGWKNYMDLAVQSKCFIYVDELKSDISRSLTVTDKEVYSFYCRIIQQDSLMYIIKYPGYAKATKIINISYIFLILMLPIVIAVTICELIIPCIAKRGYKSLGRMAFKLALVNDKGIAPKFKHYLVRFLSYLFLEVLLSMVSFLIPVFVSFSMFYFSKKNQPLHDYLSGIYMVDCSNTRVFLSEEECIESLKSAENLEIKSDNVVL